MTNATPLNGAILDYQAILDNRKWKGDIKMKVVYETTPMTYEVQEHDGYAWVGREGSEDLAEAIESANELQGLNLERRFRVVDRSDG